MTAGTSILDADLRRTATVAAIATGAPMEEALVARFASASQHYRGELLFNTDQTVTLRTVSRVAGVDTTIATTTFTGLRYNAGDVWQMRFQVTGPTVRAKAWRDSLVEPRLAAVIHVHDRHHGRRGGRPVHAANRQHEHLAGERLPVRQLRGLGRRHYHHLDGRLRAVDGDVDRHPALHTVIVGTQGTAVAGTVNIDAVQHEQAASVGAFTTTGAVIYPVFRGYLERLPEMVGRRLQRLLRSTCR